MVITAFLGDFLLGNHFFELLSFVLRVWRVHGAEELGLSVVIKAVLVVFLLAIMIWDQDELFMLFEVICRLLLK